MKILVVGADGQVGFCLTRLLAEKNWDFLGLNKSQLDISDIDAVNNIIKNFQPNIVINAAAYTAVDKAESDSEIAYNVNADGARNLSKSANEIGAVIFHISTDYVFDGDAETSYCENDACNPQSIYGASKLQGELHVINSNPKHIIMRTAWVFGEYGNNFVKTMIRLGRDRHQLSIVNDQHGGPTYAGDIARSLIHIAQLYSQQNELPWGIYHFSGLPHVSWFEFAQAIFDEVNTQSIYEKSIPLLSAINSADYITPAKRPTNSRLNCEKFFDSFGVKPSNWKQALKNIKLYS